MALIRTFIGFVLACGLASAQKQVGQEQLNSLLNEGRAATAARNAELAIQKFEQARDMVASARLPDEDLDKVLFELAGAYLNGKRPDDAEKVYLRRLDIHKKDCQSSARGLSSGISSCADILYMLGTAQMMQAKFPDAIGNLQKAEADYAQATDPGDKEEARMIGIKNQADTRMVLALALFRIGRTDEAVGKTRDAIGQLTQVADDANIQPALREAAQRYLQGARQQLDFLNRQKTPAVPQLSNVP